MLSPKEQAISHISSAISVFSVKNELGTAPKNVSMYDFILKTIPDDVKSQINVELIDEIFAYISSSHLKYE